jgi:hypothetical protein
MLLRNQPSQLGYWLPSVIRFSTRGNSRGVVEVARRSRVRRRRTSQFCHRPRPCGIGVQCGRSHRPIHVPGVLVLRRRSWPGVQSLRPRVGAWGVRSGRLLRSHRHGIGIVGLVVTIRGPRGIAVWWSWWRWRVSVWHLACWRRWRSLELWLGDL